MNQGDIFLGGEADAYTKRNAAHNATYRIEDDIVAQCIEAAGIEPLSILDVGCSTGERLEALMNRSGASFGHGIDASRAAIETAVGRGHPRIGWANDDVTSIAIFSSSYDLIVVSYVLHWIDRANLLETMARIDEAMNSGGHLVINDFHTEADVPYAHKPGVMTYKRLYPEMFIATGLYEEVHHRPHPYPGSNEACMCSVLRKK